MKLRKRAHVWMMNSKREHAMTVRTSIEQAAKSVIGALAPGESQPDILDTLHQEHEEVQDLLEKLVDSDNGREQKTLLDKVKRALVPHTKAEESVVYDAVLALKGKDAQVDGNEGYVEHTLASATLKQLDTLPAGTPEFKATAKVLKELVGHHVDEEERNIWAQVKENFTDEQREQMNRDFLAAKKAVKV
jgi:hemerythrin superfamily protein